MWQIPGGGCGSARGPASLVPATVWFSCLENLLCQVELFCHQGARAKKNAQTLNPLPSPFALLTKVHVLPQHHALR